ASTPSTTTCPPPTPAPSTRATRRSDERRERLPVLHQQPPRPRRALLPRRPARRLRPGRGAAVRASVRRGGGRMTTLRETLAEHRARTLDRFLGSWLCSCGEVSPPMERGEYVPDTCARNEAAHA